MNILFSVTNLSIGGAQMFVLNLANAIAESKEHKVYIYDHSPEYSNTQLYNYASPRVKVLSYSGSGVGRFMILKVNGLLKRTGSKFNFRKWYNLKKFERIITSKKIEIINSQMSESDFIISNAKLGTAKLIITLHGEYELYIKEKNFDNRINKVFDSCSKLIYTADKNLTVIEDKIRLRNTPYTKIYIGVQPASFNIVNINREALNIKPGAFVLGMVARGIPEKGWEFIVNVFKKLRQKPGNENLYLVLIGDGDYLKELIAKESCNGLILKQFTGNYQDYFSYYKLFDLFLFPSFFKGESVPTVLAESLYWNVPVLANNIGEIKSMMQTENGSAGETITVSDKAEMEKEYMAFIERFKTDTLFYESRQQNCKSAYKKFEIHNISEQYLKYYQN